MTSVAYFMLQINVRKIKKGKEGRKGEVKMEEENFYSAFQVGIRNIS